MPTQQESQWFIPLMGSLGYPIDKEGMCFGLAQMAMHAAICGELDRFNQRLAFLHQYYASGNINQLKLDIDSVRQKLIAEPSVRLSDREQYLIETSAFFDGIQLYQFGHDRYKSLLGLDEAGEYAWFKVASKLIMPLLTPEKLLANGGKIEKIGQYHADFSKHILKKLFMNMLSVVDSIDFPVSMVLDAHRHAISVSYEPQYQRWSLINANDLPAIQVDFDDIAKLVNEIHSSFAGLASTSGERRKQYFVTSIYVHNDNAKVHTVAEFKSDMKQKLKLKPTKVDRVNLKVSRLERLIAGVIDNNDKRMAAKLHNDCVRLIRRLENSNDFGFAYTLNMLFQLREKTESLAHQEIAGNILLTKAGKPPEHLSNLQRRGLLSFMQMRRDFQIQMKALLASPFTPVYDDPFLSNETILNLLDKIRAFIAPPVSLLDLPKFSRELNKLNYLVEELKSGSTFLKNVEYTYDSLIYDIDEAIEKKDIGSLANSLIVCLNMIESLERMVAACDQGTGVQEKMLILLEEVNYTRVEVESNLTALIENKLQSMQIGLTQFHEDIKNNKLSSFDFVSAMYIKFSNYLNEFTKLLPIIPEENREALEQTMVELKGEMKSVKHESQRFFSGKDSKKNTQKEEKSAHHRTFKQ